LRNAGIPKRQESGREPTNQRIRGWGCQR